MEPSRNETYEERLDRLLRTGNPGDTERGLYYVEIVDRRAIRDYPSEVSTIRRFEEILRQFYGEGSLRRADIENVIVASKEAVEYFSSEQQEYDPGKAKAFALAYFSLQLQAQIFRQEIQAMDQQNILSQSNFSGERE